MSDKYPWRNRDTLKKLYVEDGFSFKEIADRLDCTPETISKWAVRHGLRETETDVEGKPWRDKSILTNLYIERRMSTREIAEELGTSKGTVSDWLNKHGISTRVPDDPPWREREILERLYLEEELTQEEIAERLGAGQHTISRWLNRYNIETRRTRRKDASIVIDDTNIPDENPWRDEDTLHWLHNEMGLGVKRIGEILGCSTSTVSNWVNRFDIERGKPSYERLSRPEFDQERIPKEYPWRDKETLDYLYNDVGLYVEEISNALNCSKSTIIEWLREYEFRRLEDRKPEKSKLEQLYFDENLTGPEIGDKFGVANTTIYKWLRDYGFEVYEPTDEAYHHEQLSDEELLRELYLERELSVGKIAEKINVSQKSVYDWLQRHNIEIRSRSEALLGERNPNWEGGTFPYGRGWNERKKEKVRKRDQYTCQACGMTQEECIEEWGTRLDVHHIIPAREFDDPEERNSVENLISLCRKCHMKWEGIPIRPQIS